MQKIFIILLVAYISLSVYSCALRDAELPVTSRNTFIPPTSPDLVMVNLQFSVIEKDINNYMACFVDTNYSLRRYTYIPDVVSQIQYPIFRFWNMTNEKSYFTSLISNTEPTSASNLFFSNSKLNTFGDTAFYDADYLLHFDHRNANVSKTLKGKIRLILASDSRNLWSVHRWIDFKSDNADTTWSVLRANFSN
jgi:hypothetical protein